jgi:hypothetical protein
MVYILTEQLYDEVAGDVAFARYQAYLDTVGARMPAGARALATSAWYFDSRDHRAPHDAWLERACVEETVSPDGRRSVQIRVRLLGAYHDGHIEFYYRDVRYYRIALEPRDRDAGHGHRDWRHDEFRVAADGRVEHEIEWWGIQSTGTWLIDAADVEYHWLPLESSNP